MLSLRRAGQFSAARRSQKPLPRLTSYSFGSPAKTREEGDCLPRGSARKAPGRCLGGDETWSSSHLCLMRWLRRLRITARASSMRAGIHLTAPESCSSSPAAYFPLPAIALAICRVLIGFSSCSETLQVAFFFGCSRGPVRHDDLFDFTQPATPLLLGASPSPPHCRDRSPRAGAPVGRPLPASHFSLGACTARSSHARQCETRTSQGPRKALEDGAAIQPVLLLRGNWARRRRRRAGDGFHAPLQCSNFSPVYLLSTEPLSTLRRAATCLYSPTAASSDLLAIRLGRLDHGVERATAEPRRFGYDPPRDDGKNRDGTKDHCGMESAIQSRSSAPSFRPCCLPELKLKFCAVTGHS